MGGADWLKIPDEASPAVPIPQDPSRRPQVRDPGHREEPYVRANELAGYRPFHTLCTMVTDTGSFAVFPKEALATQRSCNRLRVAGNWVDGTGVPGIVRRGDHGGRVTSEIGECGRCGRA